MIRFSRARSARYWFLIQEFYNNPLEKKHGWISRTCSNTEKLTKEEKKLIRSLKTFKLKLVKFSSKQILDDQDDVNHSLAWYTEEHRTIHIYHPKRWIKKELFLATLAHELGHHLHLKNKYKSYNRESTREVVAELFSLELLEFLKINVDERRALDYISMYLDEFILDSTGNKMRVCIDEQEFVKLHKQAIKLIKGYLHETM